MRSHKLKLKATLLIGAGTALATALAPASASASSASPALPPSAQSSPAQSSSSAAQSSSGVIVLDCFAKPHVRPDSYLIACGDGNNGLVSLHWTHWGASSAVASGLDMVNDCQPYCAAGKFHSFPVTVRLDRVQPWPGHPQQRHYTELHVSYTANTPARTPRQVTYRILD